MSKIVVNYQRMLKESGVYQGRIDGEFGPLTLAGAQLFHCKKNAVPKWMLVASQELGVHEILGKRNNPRISLYHASTSLGDQPDEVPWCSSFVNWCFETSGLVGTNSAAARSWDTWGTKSKVLFGAVATVYRNGGSNRHVFFIAGFTSTHVFGLGGNQSDMVNVTPQRISDLTATRWIKL